MFYHIITILWSKNFYSNLILHVQYKLNMLFSMYAIYVLYVYVCMDTENN